MKCAIFLITNLGPSTTALVVSECEIILYSLSVLQPHSSSQQVQKTWLNDSVQPEQLQAMVLAHLSEDSDVGAVLDEVISDYGSSLTLRSIS